MLHADRAVIYQFIPVAPVRVMERLIRSMAPGTMAVLDLEDGCSGCPASGDRQLNL